MHRAEPGAPQIKKLLVSLASIEFRWKMQEITVICCKKLEQGRKRRFELGLLSGTDLSHYDLTLPIENNCVG